MKKSALLGLALTLALLPAGCGQDAAAPSAEIPSFSYSEVQDTYGENAPGVLRDGFQNTSPLAVSSAEEADMWDVCFFTSGVVGGCQDVYLNGSGVTCLIVYGE